jgi:hypothetical protein
MSTRKWLIAVLLSVIFIILGGAREIIFVNINEQIHFNEGRIAHYRVLEAFAFLKDYAVVELGNLKWGLTILFTAVYLVLSIVALRLVFDDKDAVRWLLVVYLGAFMLAGASYMIGNWLGEYQLGYTLSRRFMGALQSPFILMLMIPARMLVHQQTR